MNLSARLSYLATGILFLFALCRSPAQTSPANPVNPDLPSADHSRINPASKPCPAADAPDDKTYFIRQKAFDAINAHQAAEARRLMRCAIIANPADQIALRQEVYLDIDAGDSTDAIADIEALRKINAVDPQLDAQEGYIYAEKKQYGLAKQAFRRAIETGDNDTRLSSFAALRNINAEYAGRTIEFDLDSEYLNRFNDGVVDGFVHLNQRLGQGSPFQAYLNVRLLRDTASQVGKLPEIFDDNAFLTGIGLAFQPADAHFAISAEANEAYVFYAGGNHTTTSSAPQRTRTSPIDWRFRRTVPSAFTRVMTMT
jgi:tetratricopeptide (TPR) repeat protein